MQKSLLRSPPFTVAGRDASPYSLAYTTSYDKLFIYNLILQS